MNSSYKGVCDSPEEYQRLKKESRDLIDKTILHGRICERVFAHFKIRGMLDWARGISYGSNMVGVPDYAIESAKAGYRRGYMLHEKVSA